MMRRGEVTLRRLLAPMQAALSDPDTREVVVNTPGRFGVENGTGWHWHEAPELTFERLDAIGTLAAAFTSQDIGPDRPACSSRLPDGERVTVARPPMMPSGVVSLTIRKRAASFTPTLGWLEDRGYFSFLPQDRDWPAWLEEQVRRKRTFLLTGETGSSKTTLGEALIRAIPLHERIITLESTPEWIGLPHENWIPLIYTPEGQTGGHRSAAECLETTLRQRPDRILFGEMRTGEAWAYLRALMAGHPGGITTAHADEARPGQPPEEPAFDALSQMIRQSSSARGMTGVEIHDLLRKHIHIIIHARKVPGDSVPYRASSIAEVSP